MILVICEKNQIADAIMEILPGEKDRHGELISKGNYLFVALGGHALTLKEPEEIDKGKYDSKWSIENLPIFFHNWQKKPIEGKSHKIQEIKKALNECEYVINAGDIDEEGQLLVDEVLNYCNYNRKTLRLNTADLSKEKLKKNFDIMEDNKGWEALGRSALARQIADKTFGYTMTRYFTLINKSGNLVNVGRVKTPTLWLLVEREKQISGHNKSFYYLLDTESDVSGKSIITRLNIDKNSNILTDGKIKNRQELEKIGCEISGKNYNAVISRRVENEHPPLPFNLNELNKYCSRTYKYSPSKVMEITQSLRDDYKAITYNRTDCQYLSEEHFKEAPETLKTVMTNLDKKYNIDIKIKSRAFNEDNITAHHGIIPTNNNVNIKKLSVEEQNVYKAICLFYLAQFMPDCKKEKVSLVANVSDELSLKANAVKIVDDGYTVLFNSDNLPLEDENSDDDINEQSNLLSLPDGEYSLVVKDVFVKEKETKPPKRYTEASLEDDMSKISKYVKDDEIKKILKLKDNGKKGENGSIGTTATRSVIVSDLIRQGYIDVKNNKLYATNKAIDLINELPDDIKLADTTAKWWVYQEEISKGNADVSDLTDSVLETMNNVMHKKDEVSIGEIKNKKEAIGKCPRCGKEIIETSKAYSCTGWNDKDNPCNFAIYKNILGKKISKDIAISLLKNGKTRKISGFKSKTGKTFDAILVIADDKRRVVFKFK